MGVGRAGRTLVAVCSFALVVGLGGAAMADHVDDLIGKMERATDDKTWNKAAIKLFRTGDARAIPVFTDALTGKSGRSLAAYALGKLIDANTDPVERARAVSKLASAAKKDLAARRAHAKITQGVVYVEFGKFSDAANAGRRWTAVVRGRVRSVIRRAVPNMEYYGARTKHGYSVRGEVTKLTVDKSGSSAFVRCKVTLTVDRYPGSHIVGVISSTSTVAAVKTRAAIHEAKLDCVGAVASEGAKRAAKLLVPVAGAAKPSVAALTVRVSATASTKLVPPEAGKSELMAGADCRLGDPSECVATAREKLGFDEKLAYVLLEEGCNAGNISGCVILADGLRQDDPSAADQTQAAKLYEKACKSDDPSACWKLGRLHMRGESVEQDLSEATRLFKRACILGSQAACDITDESAE